MQTQMAFKFSVQFWNVDQYIYVFTFRPPPGEDPSKPHMKYDAVKLQDYEFKITK